MYETVSKKFPCEICGKSDWCFRSRDGEVHGCRRVSDGIHKTDRSGADYWLYFVKKEVKKCKRKK
jgi:hypothetical protein